MHKADTISRLKSKTTN